MHIIGYSADKEAALLLEYEVLGSGYDEILANAEGRFQPRLVDLIRGLRPVLAPKG